MKIETKYDIGQKVWMMFMDEPIEVEIRSIYPSPIHTDNDGQPYQEGVHSYRISRVYKSNNNFPPSPPEEQYEHKLFSSKIELLESFLDDGGHIEVY